MNNLTRAVFTGSEYCTTDTPLWRYDYGQQLQISGIDLPEMFEAHFSNDPTGESKTQIGQGGIVTIPDEYLLNSGYLYVWVYLHSSVTDGETRYQIKAKIRERATPSDTPPTPQQQDVITETIAALNDGVTRSNAAADLAGLSARAAEQSALSMAFVTFELDPATGNLYMNNPQLLGTSHFALTDTGDLEVTI